jgi:type II secretory pathway pseudopilin PulG
MKLFFSPRPRLRHSRPAEDGYILITLLLMVALMFIFGMVVVTKIKFDIRRDNEQEMIHRGVQYSRAIRAYFKKYQRYPNRIEDLESTNNLRYLRKRYKDPVNHNLDFKILHYGEAKMGFGGGIGGGNIPGANPIGGPAGQAGGGFQQQGSTFGGGNGAFGGNNSFGTNGNNPAGSVFGSQNTSSQNTPGQQNSQPSDPKDPNSNNSPNGPSSDSTQSGTGSSTSSNQPSGFSGGNLPIVGVVSFSKEDGIREFNHKKKYSEWQFIYDPAADRGGLINTPNQPPLQGGFGNPQNLQPKNNNGSTLGPVPGMLNDPGLDPNAPNGPGSPAPAPPTTPQPQ